MSLASSVRGFGTMMVAGSGQKVIDAGRTALPRCFMRPKFYDVGTLLASDFRKAPATDGAENE